MSRPAGTAWPLANGEIAPADILWADRFVERLAARAAPLPKTRPLFFAALQDALEPVLAGHRLHPVAGVCLTGEGLAHALYRRGGSTLQTWPLNGTMTVPAAGVDDAWDDFRLAVASSRFFLAHDVLEPVWRRSRSRRMQTAIWVAAGFHQARRSRSVGAEKLFAKALVRLEAEPDGGCTAILWLRALVESPGTASSAGFSEEWDALIGWARRG
ncbi:MAG: DUF309 domain-containing protein [Clostridia bacterium]